MAVSSWQLIWTCSAACLAPPGAAGAARTRLVREAVLSEAGEARLRQLFRENCGDPAGGLAAICAGMGGLGEGDVKREMKRLGLKFGQLDSEQVGLEGSTLRADPA